MRKTRTYPRLACFLIHLAISLLVFSSVVYAQSTDNDNDGVPNVDDFCPGTAGSLVTDNFGCSCQQKLACEGSIYCCSDDGRGDTIPCDDSSGFPICNVPKENEDSQINDSNEGEDDLIPDQDVDGVPDEYDQCANSTSILVDPFGCTCAQKTNGCIGNHCCSEDNDICTARCGVISGLPTCNVVTNNACNEVECETDTKECEDGTILNRDPALNCQFPSCDEEQTCSSEAVECSDGSFVYPDPENDCNVNCSDYYAPDEHDAGEELDEDGDGEADPTGCEREEGEGGMSPILMGALIGVLLVLLIVFMGPGLAALSGSGMLWLLLGGGAGAGIGALFGDDEEECPDHITESDEDDNNYNAQGGNSTNEGGQGAGPRGTNTGEDARNSDFDLV